MKRTGKQAVTTEVEDAPRPNLPHRLGPAAEQAEDADTARLIARVQAGEPHLFGEIYSRYFDRVFAYLRVVLKHNPDTEDIVQQAFLKVFESLPTYSHRPDQPFRAWLFIVVRNLAISHLRKHDRVALLDPTEMDNHQEEVKLTADSPFDALRWISDADLLFLISRLPDAQRQAVVFRFMLDLPTAEIAGILDRSPQAIRLLQHRALGYLKERLIALGLAPKRTTHERPAMQTRRPQSNILRIRRFMLQ